MTLNDLEKSIVLIGPRGAEKRAIAQGLHQKTGLKIISTDIFKSLDSAEELQYKLDLAIKDEISKKSVEDLKGINLSNITSPRIDYLRHLINIREDYPNIINFKIIGVNDKILEQINLSNLSRHEKELAKLCYLKQFEVKLLESIIENISEPIILNCGSSIPICPIDEFNKLISKLEILFPGVIQKELLEKCEDSYKKLNDIFSKFKNIALINLQDNNKLTNLKASSNNIHNQMLSQSGQFESLATISITPFNLHYIQDGKSKINLQVRDQICEKIQHNCLKSKSAISI